MARVRGVKHLDRNDVFVMRLDCGAKGEISGGCRREPVGRWTRYRSRSALLSIKTLTESRGLSWPALAAARIPE
ncbi:hypothetical protein GWI33_022122 [Rhynchophorus ferrugineus]|uniref:Uncharacterized protein n=1 Tax=Rhynchophorus ferrugineus TaxID=354439 RepID=A0A834MJB5_RHYFE|nr:hypothetical protein GWI33_022122 [Rhynchophorus ferrugineus]